MGGGAGANSGLFAQPGAAPFVGGGAPGLNPSAPAMPNIPGGATPNFGTPGSPMPQLAPGAILPQNTAAAPSSFKRTLGQVTKTLMPVAAAIPGTPQYSQAMAQQPNQPQRPINFNVAPQPYIPVPGSSNT